MMLAAWPGCRRKNRGIWPDVSTVACWPRASKTSWWVQPRWTSRRSRPRLMVACHGSRRRNGCPSSIGWSRWASCFRMIPPSRRRTRRRKRKRRRGRRAGSRRRRSQAKMKPRRGSKVTWSSGMAKHASGLISKAANGSAAPVQRTVSTRRTKAREEGSGGEVDGKGTVRMGRRAASAKTGRGRTQLKSIGSHLGKRRRRAARRALPPRRKKQGRSRHHLLRVPLGVGALPQSPRGRLLPKHRLRRHRSPVHSQPTPMLPLLRRRSQTQPHRLLHVDQLAVGGAQRCPHG
mmetsp:Transcript_38706/g.89694  ORF Transcript_38706/g.89694 Transcript_38706/m.89694 type:complete len:290 (+) Transcript_38706:499-1368(+)